MCESYHFGRHKDSPINPREVSSCELPSADAREPRGDLDGGDVAPIKQADIVKQKERTGTNSANCADVALDLPSLLASELVPDSHDGSEQSAGAFLGIFTATGTSK